jgi:hypothetical protein
MGSAKRCVCQQFEVTDAEEHLTSTTVVGFAFSAASV